MGSINHMRVLMGGLLAGLVINVGEFILNVPILGAQAEADLAALGIEQANSDIAIFVAHAFVIGILAVWLYAAIRPRFGAGPGTALKAGVVVWALVWSTFLAMNSTMGIFSDSIQWITMAWGVVEMPLATVAGAWLYQEAGAATQAPAGEAPAGEAPAGAEA